MKRVVTILMAAMVCLMLAIAPAFAEKNLSIWLRDIIPFGQYPQTAKGNDQTPIEWIVLEIQDGKAMLISKYGLDCQPYHKTKKSIAWEKCSLRAWLNKDFLKKAFTKEEQAAILTTEVNNGKEQGTTKDQVFLLSKGEASTYFHAKSGGYDNGQPRVEPTAYAVSKKKAYTDKVYLTSDRQPAGCWWLRSTGKAQNYTGSIRADGGIHDDSVNYKTFVVRPVIWVDLHSEVFSEYTYDSGDDSSGGSLAGESYQSWFEEGTGKHLPKLQLQSGEEPEIELIVNDDQYCDVRVFNAGADDYDAYVLLLKAGGCRIINEGDQRVEARSPEGYEIYATLSYEFLEVFIVAPNTL